MPVGQGWALESRADELVIRSACGEAGLPYGPLSKLQDVSEEGEESIEE